MRPNCSPIMNALDASKAENSVVLDAQFLYRMSGQAVFSSNTLAGSLQLQFSDDLAAGLSVDSNGKPIPVNWSNIGSSIAVTSGATTAIPLTELCYRWVRVTWTQTGGTGTITLNANTIGF